MNGYELVIPYVIAERHQRADADRLARAAQQPEQEVDEVEPGDVRRPIYHGASWVPVLRGYPYDPELER